MSDGQHDTPYPSEGPRPFGGKIPVGTIIRKGIYHKLEKGNLEKGFFVLSVLLDGGPDTIRLVGNPTCIIGAENIQERHEWPENAEIKVEKGNWKPHKDLGWQFEVTSGTLLKPNKLNDPRLAEIKSYLGSGVVEGVGPKLANSIVETGGKETFNILLDPERLQEVEGINSARAKTITESWKAKTQDFHETMLFLHSHSITPKLRENICEHYENDTSKIKEVVSHTPYQLKEISGIGFPTADRIAISVGIAPNAPERLRAGITEVLDRDIKTYGHCALPREKLAEGAVKLLNCKIQEVEGAISSEIEADDSGLVRDRIEGREFVFRRWLYNAELSVAKDLERLAKGQAPWPKFDTESADKEQKTQWAETIKWAETEISLNLGDDQRDALSTMLSNKVSLLTGGPGVGKTTIIDAFLRIVKSREEKLTIRLCAPTGKAAHKLGESTNTKADTIHRLLGKGYGNPRQDKDTPLDCDLVVVDETSMVDTVLMAQLLAAMPDRSALLLVGDPDQLPSIGPGRVLADLIESHTLPVKHLGESFRQSKSSPIIEIANQINRGEALDLNREFQPGEEFVFVETGENPEDLANRVVHLVREWIPKHFDLEKNENGQDDMQVMSPGWRGKSGVDNLNSLLQKALNRDAEEAFGPSALKIGDRVIQTKNDFDNEVFNGDIGYVTSVPTEDNGELQVSFGKRKVTYEEGSTAAVSLAYAITAHKAQGSEYQAVVIVLHGEQPDFLLRRNLLYTAVTRGKGLVVLVGEAEAVQKAIRQEGEKRHTKLQIHLRERLAPQGSGCSSA